MILSNISKQNKAKINNNDNKTQDHIKLNRNIIKIHRNHIIIIQPPSGRKLD